MYVCIVQNFYNYKTKKFFEKTFWNLKIFNNTNVPQCFLFNFSKFQINISFRDPSGYMALIKKYYYNHIQSLKKILFLTIRLVESDSNFNKQIFCICDLKPKIRNNIIFRINI